MVGPRTGPADHSPRANGPPQPQTSKERPALLITWRRPAFASLACVWGRRLKRQAAGRRQEHKPPVERLSRGPVRGFGRGGNACYGLAAEAASLQQHSGSHGGSASSYPCSSPAFHPLWSLCVSCFSFSPCTTSCRQVLLRLLCLRRQIAYPAPHRAIRQPKVGPIGLALRTGTLDSAAMASTDL